MAIGIDASVGNTGTGKTSAASLNHAAGVMILIGVVYLGTTSPSSVTVGGVAATYLTGSKVSYSTTCSVEIWYYWAAGAANDSITPTFGSNTRHAWCASSYTGAKQTSFSEGLVTGSNAGASPQTASASVGAGTTGRWVIGFAGGFDSANGSYTITAAPANGETERDERGLGGGGGSQAVTCQTESYDTSSAHAQQTTLTAAGRTILWAISAFGLLAQTSQTVEEGASGARKATASAAGQVSVQDARSEARKATAAASGQVEAGAALSAGKTGTAAAAAYAEVTIDTLWDKS